MGAGVAFLDSVDTNLKCRGPDTGHCSSWSGRWSQVCVCCMWVGIRRQKRPVTFFTWIPQRNCSSTKIGWMCAEYESTGLDLSEVESKQPLYSLSVRRHRRQVRKEDRQTMWFYNMHRRAFRLPQRYRWSHHPRDRWRDLSVCLRPHPYPTIVALLLTAVCSVVSFWKVTHSHTHTHAHRRKWLL